MRPAALTMVASAAAIAGCGGTTAKDAERLLLHSKVNPAFVSARCRQPKPSGGNPDTSGMFECQARTAAGARFDCEEEVVGGKFEYGPPTCTEAGGSNAQARHVYPHTARGRIEATLANGRHVDRVSCVERRARHYVCRLIFSDQPDNTATVDLLRNGDLLVGEDTGATAYPQTKTLSQP